MPWLIDAYGTEIYTTWVVGDHELIHTVVGKPINQAIFHEIVKRCIFDGSNEPWKTLPDGHFPVLNPIECLGITRARWIRSLFETTPFPDSLRPSQPLLLSLYHLAVSNFEYGIYMDLYLPTEPINAILEQSPTTNNYIGCTDLFTHIFIIFYFIISVMYHNIFRPYF
jgi:hypothetical protein